MFYGAGLDPKEEILLRLSSGKSLDDIRTELKTRAQESFIEMQINNTRDYLIKGLLYMGVREEDLVDEVEEWGFMVDDHSVEYIKNIASSVREVKSAIAINLFTKEEPNLEELTDRLTRVQNGLDRSEHSYGKNMQRWIQQAGGVACVYNLLNLGNNADDLMKGLRSVFKQEYCDESLKLALSLREHPIFEKRHFSSNAWRDFIDLDRKNLQTGLKIQSLSDLEENSNPSNVYNFPNNGVTSSNGKAAIGAVGDADLESMAESTSLGYFDPDTESEIRAVCEEEIPSSEYSSIDTGQNEINYNLHDRPAINLESVLESDRSRTFNVPPEKKKTRWDTFFAGAIIALTAFGAGNVIGNYIEEKNESTVGGGIQKDIDLGNNVKKSELVSSNQSQEISSEIISPNYGVNQNETFIVEGDRLIINPEPNYGLTVYANLLSEQGWEKLAGLSQEEVNTTLTSSVKNVKSSTYSELKTLFSISQQIAEMNPSSVSNVNFNTYQEIASGSNNIILQNKPLIVTISNLDYNSNLNVSFENNGVKTDVGGLYSNNINLEINVGVLESNSEITDSVDEVDVKEGSLTKEEIVKEKVTSSYHEDKALDNVVTRNFGSSSLNDDDSIEGSVLIDESERGIERIVGSDGSYDIRNELETCLDDYLELSRSSQGYQNSKMLVLSELVGRLSKGEKTDDTWDRLSYEEAQEIAVDLYIYGDGYSVSSGLNPSTFVSVNNIVNFLDNVTEGGFKKKELNQTLTEKEIQRRSFKESRKAYNAWQSWQRDLRKEEAYNSLMESGNLPSLVSGDKSYAAMQNIADQFDCTVDTIKKYVKEYSTEVPERDFNNLV